PFGKVTVGEIDFSGIPFREIQASVALNFGGEVSLQVKDLEAKTLGGKVRSSRIEVRRGELRPMVWKIERISLEEILRLHPQESVEGTGTLDGVIPMEVSEQGLRIRDGSVRARDGGTLRFRPRDVSAFTRGEPNLELVAKALENFQYTKLEGEVHYSEEGDLTVELRLEGRNLDMESK